MNNLRAQLSLAPPLAFSTTRFAIQKKTSTKIFGEIAQKILTIAEIWVALNSSIIELTVAIDQHGRRFFYHELRVTSKVFSISINLF